MDFEAIKKAAQGYQADMTRFLRDMIAIPSESCEEKGVANRIAEEMKKLGYDKVEFDKLGNVIGWMGTGDKIIALDSHIDTVGIGNIENWITALAPGIESEPLFQLIVISQFLSLTSMVSGSSENSFSESSISLAGAAMVPSLSTLSTVIEPMSVVSRSEVVTFSSLPLSSMRK